MDDAEAQAEIMYSMGLNDSLEIGNYLKITRVPGGWIYENFSDNGMGGWHSSSQFVPFNDEFDKGILFPPQKRDI